MDRESCNYWLALVGASTAILCALMIGAAMIGRTLTAAPLPPWHGAPPALIILAAPHGHPGR